MTRLIAMLGWVLAAIAIAAPPAHAVLPPAESAAADGLPIPGLVYFQQGDAIVSVEPTDVSGETTTTIAVSSREPAASPDGTRLAYVSDTQLVVSGADGSNPQPVLTGTDLGRPAWSPDGTRLAVADFEGDVADIEVVTLGEDEPDTAAVDLEGVGDTLSWSPDGTRLAFDRLSAGSVREIVALVLETGEPEVLEQGAAPSYGPDGDIVFVRGESLWILQSGAEEAERFDAPRANGEPSEFGHRRPTYAPDGSALAFEREDGEGSWITVAPVAGGESTRLSPLDGEACCPSWAPAPLGISIDDVSEVEGEPLLFRVSIPREVSFPVTVTGTTQQDTATSGDDFVVRSTSVTIPAGETEAVFDVATVEDANDEGDETLNVLLSSPQNGVINDGLAVGTIVDDDSGPPPPAVSIADTSILESADLRFTVSLSAPAPPGGVTVLASTANGTAVAPGDYTPVTNFEIEIPAGTSNVGFLVTTADDTLDEAPETLTVTLSNPVGATIGDGTATGTIVDKSRLTVAAPAAVAEGGVLRFPVRLDHPAASQVTARLATQNGTAQAPIDYTARGETTVAIPAGQTEAFFDVTTHEDLLDEGDETVTARILGSNGPASPAVLSAVGTIQNKPAPTVSVGPAPAVTEGGSLAFPVRLTGTRPSNVTVNLTTQDGSARAPGDYTATSATVTIPAGQTETTFVVPTADDGFDEPDETVTARITGGTNAFPTVLSAVGTIRDNDEPLPVVRVDPPAAVDEGSPLRFPLRLDRAAPGPIDIRLSTADGTAKAPDDYTAQTLTLVRIPAGATEAFLEVPTAQDELSESDETVRAEIKSGTNSTPSVLSATGTIRDAAGPVRLLPGAILGGKLLTGKVFVKPPRAGRFLDLGAVAGLPVGTQVDAREGVLELVSAVGSRAVAFTSQARRTQRVRLSRGVFTIRQPRRSAPVTLVLSGRELRRCGRRGRAPVRRLLADGAGRFLTKGRFAEASSRNGRWLTEDRCGSTRVRALRGRVTVRDTVRGRTRTLGKGRAITVSARR